MRSLYISATGMKSQQINLDVISNNLANVNTTGYKKGRADFEDLLYQSIRPVGASATANTVVPTGIYLGHGSRPVSTSKIFTQGAAKPTGEWSDVAVEGEGFFRVELPDGNIGYTRAGSFKIDANGILTTNNGNPLADNIAIPVDGIERDSIYVAADGTVNYKLAGVADAQQAGQLQLAQFVNPAGLEAVGSNLFLESASSGPATVGIPGENGLGTTLGGWLEASNVNIVDELVDMIVGQRAYEINSKGIQVSDEMLETAVNVKR
ncbi:MAG: flagellar basal-body rod protein FlgG [Candidatus Sumerlaeia bacterium]